MGSYQSNTSRLIGCKSSTVEFEDDWFAQGASRLAYKGVYHGDRRSEGKRCIVKAYKEEQCEGREKAWLADQSVYNKAHKFALSFNESTKTSKPIEFIQPDWTRVDTLAAFNFLWYFVVERKVKGIKEGAREKVSKVIPKNGTLCVERDIKGNFIKFSNNTGYVHPKEGSSPSAFTHFTYDATNGEILVCGLQGVGDDTGYKFTSPAVHSGGTKLGEYGPTDLGKFGILKFFKNHTCKSLCTGLKKPKLITNSFEEKKLIDKIVDAMPDDSCSSIYTHQLSDFSGVTRLHVKNAHSSFQLELVTE